MYNGRISLFPRPVIATCNIVLACARKEISLPIYYRHKLQRFRRPQTGCTIIGLTNSVAAAVRLADLFFFIIIIYLSCVGRPSRVAITHTIHGYALIIIELSPWCKTNPPPFRRHRRRVMAPRHKRNVSKNYKTSLPSMGRPAATWCAAWNNFVIFTKTHRYTFTVFLDVWPPPPRMSLC